MNNRLHQTPNWPDLARQTHWSAAALAKECQVSLRTLERFFYGTLGKSPHVWLSEERQQQAIKLLDDGYSVKETAALLGYKHATHFSREFKRLLGYAPTRRPL